MNTEEKLLKLKKLADAMYYAAQYLTTDASRLHKAMNEYHQFIINEYHKEEPINYDKLNTMLDDALAKETKESLNERLGISQEEHDAIVDKYLYGKEPELVDDEDLPKEEPSIQDIVDEYFYKMPDPNIQYASREMGIKAHAEDYSFNIESELFQQLSKEQQKLWRKEIEQACISGGYYGLNIANDKRYDKEEPVSNDFEMALAEMIDKAQTSVVEPLVIAAQWKDELIKLAKSEEPVSEDLEEAAMMHYKDVMERKIITGLETANMTSFKAGAKWQKEQIMKEIVRGRVIARFPLASDPLYNDVEIYLNFTRGLSEGDKVKVIVIKEVEL